ncbi:MAG: aminotransferase class I/II-fold pyridoxal phosphate-dependent enzyme [Clostridia bacterium]|nr:aminotransferase class I/II-fold pyridoxal phosphate-dependent enzyme [Clostridia bacterium]
MYNMLSEYMRSNPTVFHMPGHKLGRGIPDRFLENFAQLDMTEIPGTDNLHFPQGAIKEAQCLAAQAFGADQTFFLVNGSTCGVHAMIMATCKPGDKLIVARDCHKSVIHGLMLAGVEPVYIQPGFNPLFGISETVLPSQVAQTLIANPDAVGVLITRPNYYGICSEIREIAQITHLHGKMLLVDEAHGAHLKFSETLPVCAMEAGADLCVQSAHKTLPAFTQSAYLHVKSEKVDVEKLKRILGMLETSSPSYILMAYLDIARAIMEAEGKQRIEALLQSIEQFDQRIHLQTELTLLKEGHLENGALDRTRIVIKTSDAGINGYEAEKYLREQYHVQVEMSDRKNIVCIATVADTDKELLSLEKALLGMTKELRKTAEGTDNHITEMQMPIQKISLKDILYSKGNHMLLKDAVGKVSLEMITPYPPGIPLVCPGEVITEELVEYIYGIMSQGGNVTGLSEEREILVAE